MSPPGHDPVVPFDGVGERRAAEVRASDVSARHSQTRTSMAVFSLGSSSFGLVCLKVMVCPRCEWYTIGHLSKQTILAGRRKGPSRLAPRRSRIGFGLQSLTYAAKGARIRSFDTWSNRCGHCQVGESRPNIAGLDAPSTISWGQSGPRRPQIDSTVHANLSAARLDSDFPACHRCTVVLNYKSCACCCPGETSGGFAML